MGTNSDLIDRISQKIIEDNLYRNQLQTCNANELKYEALLLAIHLLTLQENSWNYRDSILVIKNDIKTNTEDLQQCIALIKYVMREISGYQNYTRKNNIWPLPTPHSNNKLTSNYINEQFQKLETKFELLEKYQHHPFSSKLRLKHGLSQFQLRLASVGGPLFLGIFVACVIEAASASVGALVFLGLIVSIILVTSVINALYGPKIHDQVNFLEEITKPKDNELKRVGKNHRKRNENILSERLFNTATRYVFYNEESRLLELKENRRDENPSSTSLRHEPNEEDIADENAGLVVTTILAATV